MGLVVVRIDNYIAELGVESYRKLIEGYVCSRDCDVENYLKNTALQHNMRDVSKTFLVFNEKYHLVGYFTLAIKCLTMPEPGPDSEMSKTFYRSLNVRNGVVQAYLIGQLSRCDDSMKGTGSEICDRAINILNDHRADIGCKAVRVDCHKPMVSYYREKGFKFVKIDENTGLYQMVALLK